MPARDCNLPWTSVCSTSADPRPEPVRASGTRGPAGDGAGPAASPWTPLRLHHDGDLDPRLRSLTNGDYRRAPVAECDLILHNAVLAGSDRVKRRLKELSARYRGTGKRAMVFLLEDFEGRYPDHDNLILLRTSARKSRLRHNEIVVPYLFENRPTPLAPCPPGARPRIAFCGWHRGRRSILRSFRRASDIDCEFIVRDRFWGGRPNDPNLVDVFYENMSRAPFNVAQRGNGNFSMRFYQVLAAGRIPVLVDTDMDLPFSDQIDWRALIVFERNEKACVERVRDLWRSDVLEARQRACRAVSESHLAPESYFRRLTPVLRTRFLD